MATKKTPAALEKRMREIQRELSLVNSDIKTLSKSVESPDRPIDVSRLKSVRMMEKAPAPAVEPRRLPQAPVAPAMMPPPPAGVHSARPEAAQPAAQDDSANSAGNRSVYDVRFKDYLASSFEAQTRRPLRREREGQKRDAIVMIAVIALIIILILLYGRPFG